LGDTGFDNAPAVCYFSRIPLTPLLETRQYTLGKDSAPPLVVKVEEEGRDTLEFRFEKRFVIGRDSQCDILLNDKQVSKTHLEIFPEKQQWWVRDLDSTNGTFKDGKKVQKFPLAGKSKVTLGPLGPLITFIVTGTEVLEETQPITDSDVNSYVEHLINAPTMDKAGARTQMLRRALHVVQKRHSRKYLYVIGIVSVIALCAAVYAYIKHTELEKQKDLAKTVFYEIKELELAQAALEKRLAAVSDSSILADGSTYKKKQRELSDRYDRFIKELGIYREDMSEKERIVFRVARVFGECEITMPPDFVNEVMKYVDLWKTSPKLTRAIERAQEMGYGKEIAQTLMAYDMPPQFFYLALKESEFDSTVCGPPTRFGIAKGVWQFIPSTASVYGLRTGPLVDFAKHDPHDERHQVVKSTVAAAKYLRDMYGSEAQASGLLVVASYNWGHNAVKSLIRKMPENPRDRNFWAFLITYRDKIPKETYDYVLYIFAAAVIGENPQLFGFKFDKPL
jgi:membrane-bound lytic murein transglycosylase D